MVKIEEYKKKLTAKNNPGVSAPRPAPDSGISAPTQMPNNGRGGGSYGWNSQAGSFDWNNIQDDRWKNLFAEVAGMIGQCDLDKDQVQLIYDMVEWKRGIEATPRDIVERRNTMRRTDPPPPTSGKG
ncbi:hypothetical protein LOD99_11299 [Oopsacas minuta]|uniref:Uncharacterized protein n=1 Tax=Oopsacas minuta TaxID=111878 RepID=A0AAV7K4V1_9METZ|nr:hypothetical protein LOD99_11299 [Oopsacas minuta]